MQAPIPRSAWRSIRGRSGRWHWLPPYRPERGAQAEPGICAGTEWDADAHPWLQRGEIGGQDRIGQVYAETGHRGALGAGIAVFWEEWQIGGGMEVNCPFCRVDAEEVVIDHDLVYARFDRYRWAGAPADIPKRHFADYFEATREEKIAIMDAVDRAKQFLDSGYHPDGYNIGVNIGKVAGQAVMHLHIHVIPRYKGDSGNHGGGMRRVIPGMQACRK